MMPPLPFEYEVIRSDRKTFSLEIRGGRVLARVPRRATARQIAQFAESHRAWAEEHLRRASPALPPLSEEELSALAQSAAAYLPTRVARFAPLVGVNYGRITIRCQRTKWGSCSAEGNLNFNCLLMLMPPEVIDGVVVHELCHRIEMNHSPRFYAAVRRVLPDYDDTRQWLRENGAAIMGRIPPR